MDVRYLEIPENLADNPRLRPMRDGTAARSLKDIVSADHFVDEKIYNVSVAVCILRSEPEEEAGADTQLLHGENFAVYGERGDWFWGQSSHDDYVGWVKKTHLRAGSAEATHHVMSRGTFLYSKADLKSRPVMKIPMAAYVKVIGEQEIRGTKYLQTNQGWLIARHMRNLDEYASDFVMVAESVMGLAYLWAGRSTFGIDCSGLIQLSMGMAGIAVMRDTDMQEQTIGEEISLSDDLSGLKRGDLIFWPGHVGMMRDEENFLHANGHTMTVFSEPLKDAIERISYLYGKPRTVRRPFALSA
ncbi:MAG: NlpC/P60 family protein [Hyphomicrobiales bacterium]